MISCIFTILFYHWRNDDKQSSTSTYTRYCQMVSTVGGSWWLKLAPNDSNINATAEIFRSLNHHHHLKRDECTQKCEKKIKTTTGKNINHHGATKISHVYSKHESRKHTAHTHTPNHTPTYKYLCWFLCQQFYQLPGNCCVFLFIYLLGNIQDYFLLFHSIRVCVFSVYCA